jgi:N-acetylglucosaminyl-diphospho-decaprenol L-rhamnosyltransferase
MGPSVNVDSAVVSADERVAVAGRPGSVAGRVARAAGTLAVRQGGVLVLGAVGAAVITRMLGPANYGEYASAIATWTLLGAAADFGFSLTLARDLSADPELHRPMLRSAYRVGTAWSLVLTLAVATLGIVAGVSTDRGLAMLVLAPSMAFNGLNAARTLLLVRYRMGPVMRVDLISTAIQVTGMVLVAMLGFGPVAVAAVVSLTSIVNSVAIAVVAESYLDPPGARTFPARELVRRSFPLGLMAVMSKVYLMLDLILLGWLVTGTSLGEYAAAAKLLTILTSVTALAANASLPALAQLKRRADLERLVVQVWHWLMVTALPIFVGAAVFATTVLRVAVGSKYLGAADLLRILTLAGMIGILSNVLGMLMISKHRNRSLLIQNAAAIILNAAGNLALVPLIGVAAAAWMTAATEILVCGCAMWSLRGAVSLSGCGPVSVRPLVAIVPATVLGLLLQDTPVIGIPVYVATFGALISILRAWPEEFKRRRSRSAFASEDAPDLATTDREPPSTPVSVEILIVSYNTGQLLDECLGSISAHLPPSSKVELSVSVFDNASADGSAELVRSRHPEVDLVHSPTNVGFAKANNILASRSKADFVMLLNPDTRFTTDVVGPLVATMRANPQLALVAPRLVFPDGRPQYSSERFPTLRYELARGLTGTKLGLPFRGLIGASLARVRRRDEIDTRRTHRADAVWATCWVLRRDDIARYGLFAEEFVTYDEDLDFCRRLRARGGQAAYIATVEVVHVGGASSTSEAKRRMMQRSRAQYYRRHGGPLRAKSYKLLSGGLQSGKQAMGRVLPSTGRQTRGAWRKT